MTYKPLGEILLAHQYINREDISQALRTQGKTSGQNRLSVHAQRIGQILLADKAITSKQLLTVLSEQSGEQIYSGSRPAMRIFIGESMPSAFMVEHRICMLAGENASIDEEYKPEIIVSDNPYDPGAVSALRMAFGAGLPFYLINTDDMEDCLTELQGFIEQITDTDARIGSGDDEVAEHLRDIATEAPIVRMVNLIFERAVDIGASDIHVENFDNVLRVRYRVDGVLHDAQTLENKYHAAMVSRLKLLAKLDIAERRIPQDGRIKLHIHGTDIDLRVATTPTINGENVVMRLLTNAAVDLEFASLGMPKLENDRFLEVIERPQGFVLVTGPTGSGKTTTLHAALRHLNREEVKIITIEDPVEIRLTGINQIQMNPAVGMTFASGLRSIVRQDPDIIMVGEIRDNETATVAIQASLTGHLVFSTLHTNDAPSSIARMVDINVENYLIAASVTGILAQRLCRRTCPDCKQPVIVSGSTLKDFPEADSTKEYTFYHGKGCEKCGGFGYRGRQGLYELMVMDEAICELIQTTSEASPIRKLARAHGMRTLREAGWQALLEGVTTPQEVRRVTQ